MSPRSEEHCEDVEYVNGANREMLESEKTAYLRDGIAECINISKDGILFALYERGRTRSRLIGPQKAGCIQPIVNTSLYFHNAKVLVDDMALRNMLIADDLSLKMTDFGQCPLSLMDTDINTV